MLSALRELHPNPNPTKRSPFLAKQKKTTFSLMSELAASSLPQEVADFIFDLHDACRRSQRIDEMKDLVSNHIEAKNMAKYAHNVDV
jgi:hypothetical protein